MDTYLPETTVKVTIPFKDWLGQQVIPTALSYRVVDEVDDEVLASTSIPTFDANLGEVEISIGPAINTLAVGNVAGYRRIELTVTVGAEAYVNTAEYVLKATSQLVVGSNSFQTYEQAVLRSFNMGELKGWERATKEQRVTALARAFDMIAAFRYRMVKTTDEIVIGDPRNLTAAEFQTLLAIQQEDFCKAQIAQADFALGGSPIEKDIAEGLQSSTIGEVSQFYRPRPSLSTALCRLALYYVGRYIHWNIEIARA